MKKIVLIISVLLALVFKLHAQGIEIVLDDSVHTELL